MKTKSDAARRKGIIWLASYPRSGNTWTRNFLYALLGRTSGHDADQPHIDKLHEYSIWDIGAPPFEKLLRKPIIRASQPEIAAVRPKVQKYILSKSNGAVLMKTHNALVVDRGFPTINMQVTSGAVYIIRNPLDVAISFAHHFSMSFDNAIRCMNMNGWETSVTEGVAYEVYGSWSENVSSWTQKPHPAIYVMRFEDMLAEPQKTFRGLVDHLLIKATDEDILHAIDASSFDKAKTQEKTSGYRERPLLSAAFFREGRAGQWCEVLTAAQIAQITEKNHEQMARFGYLPDPA